MRHKHQIVPISDFNGETLNRIFLALKSQFSNFDYEKHDYSGLNFTQSEIESSKKLFKKYNLPVIDATKKSVEETATSIVRIFDIKKGSKW